MSGRRKYARVRQDGRDILNDTKILLFDIETSLAKVYTYGLHDQNISIENIIENPRMIAFSAKWYGKRGTKFFSEYHHDRARMLDEMHKLLDEADVVAGWNSKRFDVKWVNSEFMVEGMKPPSPYKQIDLMQEVKKNARFLSAKLDYISDRLLGERKLPYSMAQMWRIVDNPDTDEDTRKREWNRMKRYAVRDTNLLEPLMDELLPWIKMPHPVRSGEDLCRNCGGSNLQRRGRSVTLNGEYTRLQCQDCGKWQRSNERSSSTNIRDIA